MRLDELANASKPVDKFVKEFLSKHQEVFQKVLHLFKKVLDVFEKALVSVYRYIFPHFYPMEKNVSQPFVNLGQLLYICTH